MSKKLNILICGVVKNAQARVERNLLLCQKLGVFWKCNSGYDNALIPEHVFLNFSLIQDGYNLFIDTNINYNWAG